MSHQPELKSRLEVNFIRLIEESQQIANGNKSKDWKFAKEARKIVVLYGSETGTAEEAAERIGRISMKYYFEPTIKQMNDCTVEELVAAKLCVFVAATTGQGDDPDSMKQFFNTLWKDRNKRTLLKGLNYGVLGLGDSSYQKFNFAAKRLNKLLNIVGAKQIINIGLADDQHELGPDFVIDVWIKQLFDILLKIFPLPDGITPTENILPPPKYLIRFVEGTDITSYDNVKEDNLIDFRPEVQTVEVAQGNENKIDLCLSTLTLNLRKTSSDHFQDVRLIEFDVTPLNYIHQPGDVLTVQPQNLDENVEEFISTLGLDEDKLFYILPNKSTNPLATILPQPCSIKQCVKLYFDIQSIPKRHFFELLSHFTTDENEREKFLEFASSEGQEEMYSYCTRPRRSITEVLADFPYIKHNIPFEYLFNLIPAIRPRAYSIASSSKMIPGRAQILMAVVNYNTILKRPRLGLCSNWLSRLEVGSTVYTRIKPGTLSFPDPVDKCPPVIMIGPGTGCAPFRSYIQERIAVNNYENLVMIFGCRGRHKDYFFKDEWEDLKANKKLDLFCAFSRDQEDKVYIQHVMKQNFLDLWKYIGDPTARIYYAGNAKRIPIDVYDALQYICEKSLGLGASDLDQYMKKSIEKRYQTESWA